MDREVDIRELSDAALVCAVADGEVDRGAPGVAERLASIPGVEAQIAHQVKLREGVARAMSAMATPAGLRDRVRVALAGESPAAAESHEVIGGVVGDTRDRSFWSMAPRFAAMAAMLALVGFVLVRGQTMSGSLPGAQRAQLINFVSDAHQDCEKCPVTRGRRLPADCQKKACEKSMSVLGQTPPALNEAIAVLGKAGIEFAGLGECNMPGDGGAVQMLFKGDGECYTSLFVQQDMGALPALEPDCAYSKKRCKISGDQLTVWRHDGFIYYLYTSSAQASDLLKSAFGVPSMRRSL